MDLIRIGQLLKKLRKEKGLTQRELAEQLNISAKTVSKWECAGGFPDVSLLKDLSEILGVNTEKLLAGSLEENKEENGNMKKIKFYVCPDCGSITTSMGEAEICCCGRRISPLSAKQCDNEHTVTAETAEEDFYITFNHEITKEHYICFAAYVRFDSVLLIRLYPEQDAAVRFPKMYGGKLYFCCNKNGLFETKL